MESISPEAFKKTGTDFCIRLTKPRLASFRSASHDLIWRQDRYLQKVYIIILHNDKPVQRELDAVARMAD